MADNYGDQVTAIGGIEFYGIGKEGCDVVRTPITNLFNISFNGTFSLVGDKT